MQRADNPVHCRLVAGLQVTEHLLDLGPGREAAEALPLHAKRVSTNAHSQKEEHALQKSQAPLPRWKRFYMF